jgi:signal transduction histidine kinase
VSTLLGSTAVRLLAHRGLGARSRLRLWALWIGLAAALAALVTTSAHLLLDSPSWFAVGLAPAAATAVCLVYGVSRRFDGAVARLLVATIVAGALLGLIVLVFGAVVGALGRPPSEHERIVVALSLAAGTLTALLTPPVRKRARLSARRLVHGGRMAPDELVDAFRARFSRAVPLDELLLQLAENLRDAFGLARAEIWRNAGDSLERVVCEPEHGAARRALASAETRALTGTRIAGEAWARVWLPELLPAGGGPMRLAAVTHAGELHGLVVVQRPGGAAEFSSDDELILADLARHVGLALHSLTLDSALQETLAEVHRQADELARSRARVVAAADSERRRIERDLHDGAQQHLIGIAAKSRLARDLVRSDPSRAAELPGEVGGDIEQTLDELRELAHGIFPSLLGEGGLAEAIPAAARRCAAPAETEMKVSGRFSPEIESAVYFCCLEALQNVDKHAGAGAAATVRVWDDGEALRFEVTDTGAGFDPGNAARGAGLPNMSDRLGAVGGRVRIESARGAGTLVRGIVPLA